jgi:hypothetical protein
MYSVQAAEIAQIRSILEDSVGSLMVISEGNFNEAEKIRIFITCSRTIGRTILWGTSISNFQLQWFLWRCSFGFIFDVNKAIDFLILYGCAILNEIEFYEKYIQQQNLVSTSPLTEEEEPEEEVSDHFSFANGDYD